MRTWVAIVAAGLLTATAGTLAHEEIRVIGTIRTRQGSVISVKARDGKTASIRLDKQTAISRDKKKVDAAELKAGLTVVVDGYGDSENDLLALEIRIVPPIGQGAGK